MQVVKIDLHDGHKSIEVVVDNPIDLERLHALVKDALRYAWLRDKEYSADAWTDMSHRQGESFDEAVDDRMFSDSFDLRESRVP